MNEQYSKIEKIRKTLDMVAYTSLILDICIAMITFLSILKISYPGPVLVTINYMLTVIVILSIGLFITLFVMTHERTILDKLNRKYQFKYKSRSLLNKIKNK